MGDRSPCRCIRMTNFRASPSLPLLFAGDNCECRLDCVAKGRSSSTSNGHNKLLILIVICLHSSFSFSSSSPFVQSADDMSVMFVRV